MTRQTKLTALATAFSMLAGVCLAQAPPPSNASSGPSPAPPSPAAADAVKTLQQVCLPVLRGAQFGAAAASAGFRQEQGAWTLTIDSKRQLVLDPPDKLNPHLCSLTITNLASSADQLRTTLASWAAAQSPPLSLVNQSTAEGVATSTWAARTPAGEEGVVLSEPVSTSAAPSPDGVEQSTLYVSLAPA